MSSNELIEKPDTQTPKENNPNTDWLLLMSRNL